MAECSPEKVDQQISIKTQGLSLEIVWHELHYPVIKSAVELLLPVLPAREISWIAWRRCNGQSPRLGLRLIHGIISIKDLICGR